MDGDQKTTIAVSVVVFLFTADVVFAYVWDALVRVGYLHADTISGAIHDQMEKQVSLAFLLGYLVCHLLRG